MSVVQELFQLQLLFTMETVRSLSLRIEALKRLLDTMEDQQQRNSILSEIRDLTSSIVIIMEANRERLNRENANMEKAIDSLLKRN